MDLLGYWQDMVDLFDKFYALLGGTPGPADSAVYAEMKYYLQPVRDVETSYVGVVQ